MPSDFAPAAPPAALVARRIGIDTYRENVAYLRRDCPVYRAEGFQALSKVEVTAVNGGERRSILAVLNVVDDERLLGDCELGLSEEAFADLGIAEGGPVRIAHAEVPASMQALKRKIGGEVVARMSVAEQVRQTLEKRRIIAE